MTYSYNFIVRRTGTGEWSILNEKGMTLHVLTRCTDREEASRRATEWASSWRSANVKVED